MPSPKPKPGLVTLLAAIGGTDGDDQISGTAGDDALSGGAGNDRLYGRAGADQLDGGSGDDLLSGGAGADRLTGGTGNDIYVVDDSGDRIVETSSGGIDTVQSSIGFSLSGRFIENLTLTGDGRIDGTGNGLANLLVGNRAANTLYGLAGNDTLDGGFGADTLVGGLGNDTYIVDNSLDRVIEAAGEGTDSIRSSVGFSLEGQFVENLTLTGAARDGSGNGLANTLRSEAVGTPGSGGLNLFGLGGDDRLEGFASVGNFLDGGTGADTMIGGSGNDTYFVDNAGDRVVEKSDGGFDLIYSSISFNLAGGFANDITLGNLDADTPQPDIDATGNSLDNILTGNNGRNRLEGKAGQDQLYGHGGDDILLSGDGTDQLEGGDGNDILDGGLGNDTLRAGDGDDTLIANGGDDILVGGAGIDRFQIMAGGPSNSASTDFRPGEDYILISAAAFGGGLYAGMDLEEENFYQPGGAAPGDGRATLLFRFGSLYLDADGSGPDGGVGIVRVGSAPLLEDIVIIA